ncbi:hypothetical protein VPH35_108955 [Triticum aestivum]
MVGEKVVGDAVPRHVGGDSAISDELEERIGEGEEDPECHAVVDGEPSGIGISRWGAIDVILDAVLAKNDAEESAPLREILPRRIQLEFDVAGDVVVVVGERRLGGGGSGVEGKVSGGGGGERGQGGGGEGRCPRVNRRGGGGGVGTKIIIGVAIGVVLLLLALIAYFTSYKFKHWSTQSLKWKYFKKKHGQLLQQLVPQRADIAEKMIITLEGLEKATNNFDKAHELGRGGHAIVYKGILSDLHIVAIKKPTMVGQREIDEFINEVAILSQINHRNIVKLYGCCLETEVPLLVYEFISNGTLYGHLHVEGPRSLPWDARLRIATEIAKSLAYLHSTAIIPIIHGDVKPANILLDDTLTAKIADFGASRYISLDKVGLTRMVQGTIGYMDPMYFRTCRLTVKSDVYSFGVMLIELMTRKKPFNYMDSEGNGLVAHFSTLFAEGSLSQVLDPQVMDEGGNKIEEIAGIAISCVKLRGEERPTMRQVEMRLEAAQPHEEFETISPSTRDGGSSEGLTSRQYSIEEEYMLSARYPR